MNKYLRKLKVKPSMSDSTPMATVCTVDVYDVLRAFNTGSAAVDHAVKKLLAPGDRGIKDRTQDIREAIASLERELEMMELEPDAGTVEITHWPDAPAP